MALSQLGSFKQHGGKFDPYSAAATGNGISITTTRALRASKVEQADQRHSRTKIIRGFAESFLVVLDNSLGRAFDPTRSCSSNKC